MEKDISLNYFLITHNSSIFQQGQFRKTSRLHPDTPRRSRCRDCGLYTLYPQSLSLMLRH